MKSPSDLPDSVMALTLRVFLKIYVAFVLKVASNEQDFFSPETSVSVSGAKGSRGLGFQGFCAQRKGEPEHAGYVALFD